MNIRGCDYDVAVIGAGPAGFAAALAAAHCGASVLLLEREAAFGGNVSQAFVHTICGLYRSSTSRRAVFAHRGLPRAFAELLVSRGLAGEVDWARSAGFLPIDPEGFASMAERLCAEAPHISRWTSTRLASLELALDDGDVCRVEVEPPGGVRWTATAWTVIDTTGDANAATLAGVPTESASPEELQHPSYIFRVDGVDVAALNRMERARVTASVARAARKGALQESAASIVVRPAVRENCVFVTLNLPKPEGRPFDALDPAAVDRMQERAVRDAAEILRFLSRERAPFRNACLGAWPARIGIRESRRIVGLHRLEAGDVLDGRQRADEACVSTWPIELWESHERLVFQAPAGPSSIPLGCLIANHPGRRLAMAGRCASSSHEALGAIRVIATSMAMGEAAGAACALAASSGRNLAEIEPAGVREVIGSGRTTAGL